MANKANDKFGFLLVPVKGVKNKESDKIGFEFGFEVKMEGWLERFEVKMEGWLEILLVVMKIGFVMEAEAEIL